ncbi:SixA phosphatase family protein [Roseospira visakhapatnamensis]|uniref:Phosphohistidine phosphatase n=1 Tax=Roseospira visakhapatnamensis TaxID=390880 RepID=A0A7W6W8C7_9PROT|nr:histidine phosphatase family protein [Roseospira visakhapatnamensis]MBB4264875.1 phosphohistidine phosphatase [Roseospira visakhapatnamensis]
MKYLYLLRHAKSSWENPNIPDHDRPLARRGERAGAAIATVVAALSPRPDLVLCSTATRAQETLALVRHALGDTPVRLEPVLYTLEAVHLRQHLERLDDAATAVLVIGHNPSLEVLAQDLAAADSGPAMTRLRRKFPTATLADLDLPIATWAALGETLARGDAHLRRFTRPADLRSP